MKRKPIAVIEQVRSCPPGRLGEFFQREQVPWKLFRPAEGDPLPPVEDIAGLVVLGGPMSANDELPYLQDEMHLLRSAVSARVPVLGICLGGQLLAKALGAEVRRCAVPEMGLLPITPSVEAGADPLLRGVGAGDVVPQWHSETFDLPSGAQHLASSEACQNQAFRFGDCAWGLQFHPEVNKAIFEHWRELDQQCVEGPEAAGVSYPEDDSVSAALAERLFQNWKRLCGY